MNKVILGITGNIASGKTLLLSIFRKKGFPVISSDEIVSRLYTKGEAGYNALKKLNLDIFYPDQTINKSKLRFLLLNDPKIQNIIKTEIHPLVKEELVKFISASGNNAVFLEIPLLFESHLENFVDKIILIYTKPEISVKRSIERNKISHEEAMKFLELQLEPRKKIMRSDFVIFNNIDFKDLDEKADKIIEVLNIKPA